jgi:hypothetical protein
LMYSKQSSTLLFGKCLVSTDRSRGENRSSRSARCPAPSLLPWLARRRCSSPDERAAAAPPPTRAPPAPPPASAPLLLLPRRARRRCSSPDERAAAAPPGVCAVYSPSSCAPTTGAVAGGGGIGGDGQVGLGAADNNFFVGFTVNYCC